MNTRTERILKETFGILARGFGQRRPTTANPTGERQPFNLLCVVNCSLQRSKFMSTEWPQSGAFPSENF